jgi:uncharacterized protein (TIGR02246 family)
MVRIAMACTVLACATSRPASVDVVQRQLDAYNAQNLDAFAATYSDDVLITRGPEKKPFVQGKQELREVYGKMFTKYPNCRARLAERKTEGDNVVLDHEIVTGRGPERPDPWDVGFVRYMVENGKIKTVELP